MPSRDTGLPCYLPARQTVAWLPVASQLDGRVLCEELVDILHRDLAHIYIDGALCGDKQRRGQEPLVLDGQFCCIPARCLQH